MAEHFLGKEKVPGSNPGVGSTTLLRLELAAALRVFGKVAINCSRKPIYCTLEASAVSLRTFSFASSQDAHTALETSIP